MNLICNKKCSIFCLFISIWGLIQLLVMGVCCSFNALAFVTHLPLAENYDNLQEFRSDSDRLYKDVALRFYATAALYGVFATLSLLCIRMKKRQMIREKNAEIRRSHLV
ncbi:ribonuclease kappa [Drosophila nasuta]|uniref:Ribonuclease kappa n=1 Tax=Drosophila albomicans TaxID=7291 RepID=A0A6P8XE98_DROAB|nr:ribonuclease kappa [Drosophila albomicans]XP_060656714.1 ribonuclease kappa [Drosophila nasuta]